MPILGLNVIRVGSASNLLFVHLTDATPPSRAKTGLTHASDGAHVVYAREGESDVHPITLIEGSLGVHTRGGFVEVDPDHLPGSYQLGAPDELFAEGAPRALVLLRFPGARAEVVSIELVAFDPQDAETVGIQGLGNQRRHEFLRGAMPRMTEEELSQGESLERVLTAQIDRAGRADHEGPR